MQAKQSYREKAIHLRTQGLSYNEIRKTLPVSKSTLSLWLKGILLSPAQRERLYTKQIKILELGAQCQKERREREIVKLLDDAQKEITMPLPEESYRLFGAALYWAEGTKGSCFEITNSDPQLILFMVHWFKKVFFINPRQLKAHLNIYEQQSEKKIKQFWSELCGIPLQNFGKSFIKPGNKGYKKNNLYFGTIKIRVPKGTDLRLRAFGWVQKVLQEINPSVTKNVRRWHRLKKTARPVNLIASARSLTGKAVAS